MINNAINSPALGNVSTVNDAILSTNGSGVAAFRNTISGAYTFSNNITFSGTLLFSSSGNFVANAKFLNLSMNGQFFDNQTVVTTAIAATIPVSTITSKVLNITGTSTDINQAWPTAANLVAAMQTPLIGSTIDFRIINNGGFNVTLLNTTDPTHVDVTKLVGGASVLMRPGTTLDLRIILLNVNSGTESYEVVGGYNPDLVGSAPLFVDTVANSTYNYFKAPYAGTITSISSICGSGTCTATTNINGTPVTATANSVSTTNQDRAVTGANTFVAGDYISVVVTSNSACLNMAINVFFSYKNT